MSARVIDGRYELLELLGGGTFTTVHRARRLSDGEMVAIKLLEDPFSANSVASTRFSREIDIGTALRHPFVVRAHEGGRAEDGTMYLVMELLRGQSLGALIHDEGSLPTNRVLRIAIQLANALVEAHGSGWIHRDLKPDNVFICEDGGVKLFDFGLARSDAESSGNRKITRAGMSVGTMQYMAPEQLKGRAEMRSDIFAFGVLLYECLTGEHPWSTDSAAGYITAVQTRDPADLADHPKARLVPIALARLVMSMLSREPDGRPASAREILARLVSQSTSI